MRCIKPISIRTKKGGTAKVKCGQCLPCRAQRQNVWITRATLERHSHPHAAFVTLTYRCPIKRNATLDYSDIQLFLKRLRSRSASSVRFLAVGEYGTKSGHAHWHLILYGSEPDLSQARVTSCWPHGFCHIGTFTLATVRYVMKYITKEPENSEPIRCSQRPGLGFGSLRLLGRGMYEAGVQFTWSTTTIGLAGCRLYVNRALLEQIAIGYNEAGGLVTPPTEHELWLIDHVKDLELDDRSEIGRYIRDMQTKRFSDAQKATF
jgi:hypothetical protein